MQPIDKTSFQYHAAHAFFASAWADACDNAEQSEVISGCDVMQVMPEEIDPEALLAAWCLQMKIEALNICTVTDLLEKIKGIANGDRPCTMEYFGHYAALQAMGHGVGLHDAFGSDVYDRIKVPHVEFGGYSLSMDYFKSSK